MSATQSNISLIEHLSYSSITTYLTCPASWRFKYVEKIPTYSTPDLIFGKAMHQTIEENIMTQEDLLSIWGRAWNQALEGEQIVWGTDTPEQHFNEGVRILSDRAICDALSELQATEIERKVELRVPGVPVPVIGYIDMIDLAGVPGDFKTSAKSWSADRATGETQPLFYLAALNQLGEHNHEWTFRHYVIVKTKQPKIDIFEHKHTPGQVMWLFGMIRHVWEAISRNVYPENPTTWKCSPAYCDFWGQCRGKYD